MPKVSSENAEVEDHGPVLDRHGEVDGYTVNIVEFRQDMDQTLMLKGCPTAAVSARTGDTCSRAN
jgi:hypothetical protein